jgi:hypothetical protein
MDLKETDILGADIAGHWYYRSKAKAMMCLLDGFKPGIVLDVGVGPALFESSDCLLYINKWIALSLYWTILREVFRYSSGWRAVDNGTTRFL